MKFASSTDRKFCEDFCIGGMGDAAECGEALTSICNHHTGESRAPIPCSCICHTHAELEREDDHD